MARKKSYYFRTFVELVQYSCDAAVLLNEIVNNFKVEELEVKMKEMHEIEHAGTRAGMLWLRNWPGSLLHPSNREDIIALADAIDNVTDTIEDVLLRFYMFNITAMREDAVKMAIIVQCCEALKEAVAEFANFRNPDAPQLIVEINRLEEEGDALFTKATRTFVHEKIHCRSLPGRKPWIIWKNAVMLVKRSRK